MHGYFTLSKLTNYLYLYYIVPISEKWPEFLLVYLMLTYGSLSVLRLVWIGGKGFKKLWLKITCRAIQSKYSVPSELFLFVFVSMVFVFTFHNILMLVKSHSEFLLLIWAPVPALCMYVELFRRLNLWIILSTQFIRYSSTIVTYWTLYIC